MEADGFAYTTFIKTTPQRLWQAPTDPAYTRRYWGGTELESDWGTGSTFTVRNAERGFEVVDPDQVVIESDPYRRLVYTWHTFTEEWGRAYGIDDLPEEDRGRTAVQGQLRARTDR